MGKFAIAKNTSKASAVDPSVTKATTAASPIVLKLAEHIISLYDTDGGSDDLTSDEKAIQALFTKWGNSPTTAMLAELTDVLTGFKPVLPAATNHKLGRSEE